MTILIKNECLSEIRYMRLKISKKPKMPKSMSNLIKNKIHQNSPKQFHHSMREFRDCLSSHFQD